MNNLVLSGRLATDIALRTTTNGVINAMFTLAVKEGSKTMFIRVSCYDKVAEACNNNLQKGDRIMFDGKISVTSKKTASGYDNQTFAIARAIEFVSTRGKGGSQGNSMSDDYVEPTYDEEIPF